MNNKQHPITPPLELVRQWCARENERESYDGRHIATQAARWGADQELQACCEWLRSKDILEPAIEALRADRRPKPPCFKQQALEALAVVDGIQPTTAFDDKIAIIRQALELLPDEEV